MVAFIDAHRGSVRSRADLRGAADRSVDLLRAEGARGRSDATAGAGPARRRSCAPRSSACGRRTGGSTARRRCGSSCDAKRCAVARCTVARLMRHAGLRGVVRGRRVRTTIPDAAGRSAAGSGAAAVHGDAAESAVGVGLHLRRDVAGLRLRRVRDRRVLAPHRRAGARRRRCAAISRSTRSSKRCTTARPTRRSCITATAAVQYLSIRYTERLAEAGIEPSVGSRGDAYDNALAETVIGLFKTEVISPGRPLEGLRGGRVRHARMGGLVQHAAPAGTARLRPAGGVRGAVPPCPGRPLGPGTQLTELSGKPGAIQLAIMHLYGERRSP